MSVGLEVWLDSIDEREMITADGVELPEGSIADIQDSYEYLGIPQANGNHEEAARRSTIVKYL